ncbi:MAG: tRNA lysidine(34) synthetase TilS, partial [Paracoccaceae bacterium]|nr:tRNA lysidine(34) synthetase TilS [Paracoccaceae bacterium]
SLAMLHVLVRAAWSVRAVTVDHGLRPEAAAEARMVAQICAALGVEHDTLRWDHGAIAGNVQDQARRARYGLIADWARAKGITHVAVGHTADDNAETVLLGLAREAGLDGLCGMRPRWQEAGLEWGRPFLAQTRADLRRYLGARGIGWIDDPSNEDDHYTRVRARKVLAALAPLGITSAGLNAVAGHLASVRASMDWALAGAVAQIVRTEAGEVIVDRAGFDALPAEFARRLVIAALRWVSGAGYAPRAAAVQRVQEAVQAGRDCTLWGCRIRATGQQVRIYREARAVVGVVCDTGQLWDGRWRLEGPHAQGLQVRALGAAGLLLCKEWRKIGVSRGAALASPAIWRGNVLICAPLAGFGGDWAARIVTSFHQFVVSH